MSKRLSFSLLSLAAMFAAQAHNFPRTAVEKREATAIPRNHAARVKRSRRSVWSTRPAQPHNAQENFRRVCQMARGIKLA